MKLIPSKDWTSPYLFHTFSLLFILHVILRCHFRFPDLCKPRTKSSKPRIPRLDFGFVVWKNWEMLRCSRSTKGSFQAACWAAQFPDHLRASFLVTSDICNIIDIYCYPLIHSTFIKVLTSFFKHLPLARLLLASVSKGDQPCHRIDVHPA